MVLVDDETLQNWEFHFKQLTEDDLKTFWEYNNLKSAETGQIVDTFVISFANPDSCIEEIDVGRVIQFAPIIKYLQTMGLPKKLNTIEEKVKNNIKITIEDELTLIFVTLSVPDKDKEEILNRVCAVLDEIDYINNYRRTVIDTLISFQIENFVKDKENKNDLNEVVDMQVPVEELFLQVERESEYDEGYAQGRNDGKSEEKDEIILNMLSKSFDFETIQDLANCSRARILRVRDEFFPSK